MAIIQLAHLYSKLNNSTPTNQQILHPVSTTEHIMNVIEIAKEQKFYNRNKSLTFFQSFSTNIIDLFLTIKRNTLFGRRQNLHLSKLKRKKTIVIGFKHFMHQPKGLFIAISICPYL